MWRSMKPKTLVCIDVRTCGLIIAYMDLFSALLSFVVLGPLFAFAKLAVSGCLLGGIYTKKPGLLVPFLVEHCLAIIGAIIAVLILILKPSDDDIPEDVYTTVFATELPSTSSTVDPIDGHHTLVVIIAILAIALSVHSWIIIFTLYQEYTYLQFAALKGGPFAIAANPPQRNVATIENEIALQESRHTFVGVR